MTSLAPSKFPAENTNSPTHSFPIQYTRQYGKDRLACEITRGAIIALSSYSDNHANTPQHLHHLHHHTLQKVQVPIPGMHILVQSFKAHFTPVMQRLILYLAVSAFFQTIIYATVSNLAYNWMALLCNFSCRVTSTYLGELHVALILACAYCKDTGHCSLVSASYGVVISTFFSKAVASGQAG